MQSRTKDILFKVGAAIVCILAYAMTSNLENNVARPSYCCGSKKLSSKTVLLHRPKYWSVLFKRQINVRPNAKMRVPILFSRFQEMLQCPF